MESLNSTKKAVSCAAIDVSSSFLEGGYTLSVAESFTGGNIAAALVALDGTSKFLLESLVCYSNAAKQLRLGVKPGTLDKHSAVSEEVAYEMAEGLLESELKPDFVVCTTGNAAAAMSENTIPGECYVAVGHGDKIIVKKLSLCGDRAENIAMGTLEALLMLNDFVKNQ